MRGAITTCRMSAGLSSRPPLAGWAPVAVVLAVSAALLGFDLGARVLATNDEARFPMMARDIVSNGHWLLPEISGVPMLNKPPLHAWLIADDLAGRHAADRHLALAWSQVLDGEACDVAADVLDRLRMGTFEVRLRLGIDRERHILDSRRALGRGDDDACRRDRSVRGDAIALYRRHDPRAEHDGGG